MTSIETLNTERLIGKHFRNSDFPELCLMHQDQRVMATLGGIRSDDETQRFLQEKMAHWERHGFGYWMFRAQETGAFVGRGGLQHIHIGGNDEVEIGYSVLADYWGNGYATEMANALLTVGFEHLGLATIVCFTLTTNQASERVMQKIGFAFERKIIHADQPHVLYRMGRAQYSPWLAGISL